MRYTLRFSARNIGSLGTWSTYTETRMGSTPEEARLALYNEYEHVVVLACTPAEEGTCKYCHARIYRTPENDWVDDSGGDSCDNPTDVHTPSME